MASKQPHETPASASEPSYTKLQVNDLPWYTDDSRRPDNQRYIIRHSAIHFLANQAPYSHPRGCARNSKHTAPSLQKNNLRISALCAQNSGSAARNPAQACMSSSSPGLNTTLPSRSSCLPWTSQKRTRRMKPTSRSSMWGATLAMTCALYISLASRCLRCMDLISCLLRIWVTSCSMNGTNSISKLSLLMEMFWISARRVRRRGSRMGRWMLCGFRLCSISPRETRLSQRVSALSSSRRGPAR